VCLAVGIVEKSDFPHRSGCQKFPACFGTCPGTDTRHFLLSVCVRGTGAERWRKHSPRRSDAIMNVLRTEEYLKVALVGWEAGSQ
jgi:hypothetical protein